MDDGVSLRFHYRCKLSILKYCDQLCYDGMLQSETREDSLFPWSALGGSMTMARPRCSAARNATYPRPMPSPAERKLLELPGGDGPVRLSADGLAMALAPVQEKQAVSAAQFSARLFGCIAQVDAGQCDPQVALVELAPQIMAEMTGR
ncbi:hypothetical protein [Massilia sp. S19_KUP03_FR1]|uniref:hypothetical protein n=1 Tax=Massilia sp. S19_KUP03_FR1 TaxID=3025503 RepID=UPI002FCD9602